MSDDDTQWEEQVFDTCFLVFSLSFIIVTLQLGGTKSKTNPVNHIVGFKKKYFACYKYLIHEKRQTYNLVQKPLFAIIDMVRFL